MRDRLLVSTVRLWEVGGVVAAVDIVSGLLQRISMRQDYVVGEFFGTLTLPQATGKWFMVACGFRQSAAQVGASEFVIRDGGGRVFDVDAKLRLLKVVWRLLLMRSMDALELWQATSSCASVLRRDFRAFAGSRNLRARLHMSRPPDVFDKLIHSSAASI